MSSSATLMWSEVRETPDAVARALDGNRQAITALARRLSDRAPASVATCARGSSDHAAGYFKYLTEIELGAPVASIGPSIGSVYRAPLRMPEGLLVSVSQSGQSPDIVALQEAARRAGALTVAVVNVEASPLADGADIVLPLQAGPERSVAATKTCLASAAVLAALVAAWRGDAALEEAVAALPEALSRAVAADWSVALPVFRSAQSAYTVGRGPAFPVAQEAALKLKETAVLHAEAFSGAEVMHGPLQLLEPGFPVLALAPADEADGPMRGTISRLREAGGRVFVAGGAPGEDKLPFTPTGHVRLDPLAMLLSFYALAERIAVTRGHDPDRPTQLRKVTETV